MGRYLKKTWDGWNEFEVFKRPKLRAYTRVTPNLLAQIWKEYELTFQEYCQLFGLEDIQRLEKEDKYYVHYSFKHEDVEKEDAYYVLYFTGNLIELKDLKIELISEKKYFPDERVDQ